MLLSYSTKRIAEAFEDMYQVPSRKLMVREIGLKLARSVKKRSDQMRAASSFQEYMDVGLGHPEHRSGRGFSHSVRLDANSRMIFSPVCDSLERAVLASCHEAEIEGVADYHGRSTKWNWILR